MLKLARNKKIIITIYVKIKCNYILNVYFYIIISYIYLDLLLPYSRSPSLEMNLLLLLKYLSYSLKFFCQYCILNSYIVIFRNLVKGVTVS